MMVEPLSDDALAKLRDWVVSREPGQMIRMNNRIAVALLARLDLVEGAYNACASVATKRVQNIAPDVEAEIPRLCKIDQKTWLLHKEKAPICAVDMLVHAKLALKAERIAALEAAIEPFTDVAGEGSKDFEDDEPVVVTFGRTTHYALKLGDLRRARDAERSPQP